MPSFPATFMILVSNFAPLFSRRVWQQVPILPSCGLSCWIKWPEDTTGMR